MTLSKILKQSTNRTIEFSILVENFPSFVTSKAEYKSVSTYFNNTEWYISIEWFKYSQTSKQNIYVTPSSSDQPETLGAFVYGRRSDQKECSFNVGAIFKFKQPLRAENFGHFSHKFIFNSTNDYDARGSRAVARIDVFLTL